MDCQFCVSLNSRGEGVNIGLRWEMRNDLSPSFGWYSQLFGCHLSAFERWELCAEVPYTCSIGKSHCFCRRKFLSILCTIYAFLSRVFDGLDFTINLIQTRYHMGYTLCLCLVCLYKCCANKLGWPTLIEVFSGKNQWLKEIIIICTCHCVGFHHCWLNAPRLHTINAKSQREQYIWKLKMTLPSLDAMNAWREHCILNNVIGGEVRACGLKPTVDCDT